MTRKWRASLLESPDSEQPLTSVDFGVVPEGESKSLSLWLRNLEDVEVHGIEIQLENNTVWVEGEEIELESAVVVVVPESLGPMEAKEVEFTWRVDESVFGLRQPFRLRARMLKESVVEPEVMLYEFVKDRVEYYYTECMMCHEPPTVEVIWAKGRAHSWFCDEHFEDWASTEMRAGYKGYTYGEDIGVKRRIAFGVATKGWFKALTEAESEEWRKRYKR